MAQTVNVRKLGEALGKKTYERLTPYMGLIHLKIAMDIYNKLVGLTPVDTGYLKLSLTTTLNGEPTFIPEPRAKDAKTGQYVADAEENVSRQLEALSKFKMGDILDIGYTANYAPYVEDMYHMVKTVRAQLRTIVRNAFNEAKKGLQ